MRDRSISIPSDAGAPRDGTGLLLIQAATLLLAVGLLAVARASNQVGTLSVVFVSIVLEALPFVLLGALLGGFIEVFVPRDWLATLLPARPAATVFLAGLLGLIFPVCECAVVPVVRRLVRKGVPFSAAVAYLLAGPIVNPIVAASTAVAYALNWNVVILRLVAGYTLAVAIGLLLGELFPGRTGLLADGDGQPDHDVDPCGCGAAAPAGRRSRGLTALAVAAADFTDIARFLVLGAFFAGLMQTCVERPAFVLLMATPPLAIAMMMALAIALNLCSEADAFVAASFQGSLPLSAQLAFMVLGPMLDVKLLFMYLGLFRRRAILALVSATILSVFVTMLLVQLFGGEGR